MDHQGNNALLASGAFCLGLGGQAFPLSFPLSFPSSLPLYYPSPPSLPLSFAPSLPLTYPLSIRQPPPQPQSFSFPLAPQTLAPHISLNLDPAAFLQLCQSLSLPRPLVTSVPEKRSPGRPTASKGRSERPEAGPATGAVAGDLGERDGVVLKVEGPVTVTGGGRETGERGRDLRPRKPRRCRLCQEFRGTKADQCPGKNGRGTCQHFTVTGDPKPLSFERQDHFRPIVGLDSKINLCTAPPSRSAGTVVASSSLSLTVLQTNEYATPARQAAGLVDEGSRTYGRTKWKQKLKRQRHGERQGWIQKEQCQSWKMDR
eukprot:2801797-Rhodomonas_salina.1